MEVLTVLEKKVADLVDRINKLRADNDALNQENVQLRGKLESLKALSLSHSQENNQERELTKTMVDSLIRDIDAVVEREHQQ